MSGHVEQVLVNLQKKNLGLDCVSCCVVPGPFWGFIQLVAYRFISFLSELLGGCFSELREEA